MTSPMPKRNKLRVVQPIDPVKLKSYVARIETVEEEQAALKESKADIYTEVEAAGMRPKMVRKIIRERAKKEDDAAEQAELDRYRAALAMPGATIRSVAAQFNVPRTTLHRRVSHSRENGTEPPHDPETGELDTRPGTRAGMAENEASPAPLAANNSDTLDEATSTNDDLAFPAFLDRRKQVHA